MNSATKNSRPTKASVLDLTTAILSLLPRKVSRLYRELAQLVSLNGELLESLSLGGLSTLAIPGQSNPQGLLCCDSDSATLTGTVHMQACPEAFWPQTCCQGMTGGCFTASG